MKLFFFDVDEWAKEYIKKALPNAIIIPDRLSVENISEYKDAEIISVFHTSDLSKDILHKLGRLNMIATRTTGYNHIDIAYCKKNNIIVSNVPSYGKHTVAEHAFGLILTLTRHLYDAIHRVKHDGKFCIDGLKGIDLFGKTLGIVGLGDIGMSMARIGRGFGMRILVHTRTHTPELALELGFEYACDLPDLLGRSDIISLHVPYCKETANMISRKNISQIKKGAYLINTARGGLIETEAMVQGLEEGILSGIGLDVLEEEVEFAEDTDLLSSSYRKKIDYENLVFDHVLAHNEKVVITPHNAFNTTEARIRILETTINNIRSYLIHKPQNIVVGE